MDSPHSLAHFKFKPVFGNAYKEVSNVVSPLSCCEYGIKGDLIIIAKKTQASDIFHGPVLTLVTLKYVFFFCFFFFFSFLALDKQSRDRPLSVISPQS